jgi:hypothetical protein
MHVDASPPTPTADEPAWPVLTPAELDGMIARHQRMNAASVILTRLIDQCANDEAVTVPPPVVAAK